MARTTKTGLDYFPFDVDFFEDEKVQFASAKFGIKGEIVAIKLLCRIYRNGYCIKWGEDESILFAKRAGEGINHTTVLDIVQELVDRNFFNKQLLEKCNILTSKGIQTRYLEATKRRKETLIPMEHRIISINDDIYPINADINSLNADKSTQRKEKKSKEKEIMSPTINECINFFKENSSTQSSAERFFNNYESVSWKKGGTIISDWKSLARNWIDGDKTKSNNGNGNNAQKNTVIDRNTEEFKQVMNKNNDELKKSGKFRGFGNVESEAENKTNDDLPI